MCLLVRVCIALSVMLARTHTHMHTVSSGGAWGPIYLHAVEEEQRIEGRDKTKREGEKKRKQQGIMEKTQWNEQVSLLFPRTDSTNLLFRWLSGGVLLCGFCLPVS